MAAAYATVDDLTRLWRAMTTEEQGRAQALLDIVSASLRVEACKVGKDLDAMVAESDDLAAVAKSVTVDVVARTLMTSTDQEPMTQMSQTAGPYSTSGTFLVPGGGLFIKRSDVVYNHQISNKSFLLLCETMCQETDTGFRVVRMDKKVTVEFYKPEADPNRILSERYGSLKIDAITLSTENKKNHAIVLGEGEGEARVRVDVDLSAGEQKRSMFVDARDILREEGETDDSYNARLAARGYEKLLEQKGTWTCAMNPLPQEFGTLYDLGDIITVLLPDYDLRLQSRLTRFTQQSQNNVIDTILEVGTITILR